MLQLVTPATESIAFVKRHMPGLNDFIYEDASDFVSMASRERAFSLGGDYELRLSSLTASALGFLHGEIVALSDRRDDADILSDLPHAVVGHPIWEKTVQMVGKSPASPVALAVAMRYVAGLGDWDGHDDLPHVMHATFAAYGAVMGYERGRSRIEAQDAIPLPPDEMATFMATAERLLEVATQAVAETVGHYGETLGAIYGDDDEALGRFVRALTHSTATYATNAILSGIRKSHLACPGGLVVGRIRSYASQNARGMLDGITGSVSTDSLVTAIFDDDIAEGTFLGDLPLGDAVRDAASRICEEPMTEGIILLATARAWDLCNFYGDDGSDEPVDFAQTGETIMGSPVMVCVDADERIAVNAVAYVSGVRQAYGLGHGMISAKVTEALEAMERDEEAGWDPSWDVEASDSLPKWVATGTNGNGAEDGADDAWFLPREDAMPADETRESHPACADPSEARRGFRLI